MAQPKPTITVPVEVIRQAAEHHLISYLTLSGLLIDAQREAQTTHEPTATVVRLDDWRRTRGGAA